MYYFHEQYYIAQRTQTEYPEGPFDCFMMEETHPVIFVGGSWTANFNYGPGLNDTGSGEGSHGSYPMPGEWEDVVDMPYMLGDIHDRVDGDGAILPWFAFVDYDDTDQDGVVLLKNPAAYSYPQKTWHKANIHWGRPLVWTVGSDYGQAEGEAPRGPAHQNTWNNPYGGSPFFEFDEEGLPFESADESGWEPTTPFALTSPNEDAEVSDVVYLVGTIHYADQVIMEYGAGVSPANWSTNGFSAPEALPVLESTIGSWNTGVVPEGTYTVRVRTITPDDEYEAMRTVHVTHKRITVAPSGGDYTTMQNAITAAEMGDTIFVQMGSTARYESITMRPTIRLVAVGGPVLDVFGDSGEPTITVSDDPYPCYIEGFTFRHSHWPPQTGGGNSAEHGALITNASPIFKNCTFKANVANYGGGVRIQGTSRPIFDGCTFVSRGKLDGGGIAIRESTPGGASVECVGCSFIGSAVGGDDAGAAVSIWYSSSGTVTPSVFTGCTFTEHDVYGTNGHDDATIHLHNAGQTQFNECVFWDNGTNDLVRLNASNPIFDQCTLAQNSGVDGIFGWIGSVSDVDIERSIVAYNDGPLAVGSSSLSSDVHLESTILYTNTDQGRGPTDTFWAGTGQDNLSINPAFCNGTTFDFRLYAFSPAAVGPGYFENRIGALDVGCVPPATITAASSTPIAGKDANIVTACQGGDWCGLVVTVDLDGSVMTRNVDQHEITLDVMNMSAKVFDQDGILAAGADAIDPNYVATISHSYFGSYSQDGAGNYGVDTVTVLLNGHPLTSAPLVNVRTFDTTTPFGTVTLTDFAVFGGGYPSPPKAYKRFLDMDDDGDVDLQEFGKYGAHYTHVSPWSPINNSAEVPEADTHVSVHVEEEFPSATTHRLYVEVSVEAFVDVSHAIFSMQTGSNRLTFVEWQSSPSALGEVLFARVDRGEEIESFFGVITSPEFDGSSALLGRLVFDVTGLEPFELTDNNFRLTIGDILVESPGGGAAMAAEMNDVVGRILDPAVQRTFHNRLEQNFPNPFNPTTTLAFSIKAAGNVNLTVYDVVGRRVRELVNERRERGAYKVVWDGQNDTGQTVASGVYFYKITAGSFTDTRKMTILK